MVQLNATLIGEKIEIKGTTPTTYDESFLAISISIATDGKKMSLSTQHLYCGSGMP